MSAPLLQSTEVIIGLFRLSTLAHRCQQLARALQSLEQIREIKALGMLPAVLADSEPLLKRQVAELARRLSNEGAPFGLVSGAVSPDAVARLARRVLLESAGAVQALERGAQEPLSAAAQKLWDRLALRPEFAAIEQKLGHSGFEQLVAFGRGLTPVAPADFGPAIVYRLKGRTNEIAADLNPAWQAAIMAAGDRGGRLLQALPNPEHWHFRYESTDIEAFAFRDAQQAAAPAALLDALKTEVDAAELAFSEVTTGLVKCVDKSAWMLYDDGLLRVGLPMLFGESKGLKNLRDLITQFPKDIERGGLGVALIGGKPTLVLLLPSLSRLELAGIGPRALTPRRIEQIERVGARVIPISLGIDNAHALEFSSELGKLLGLRLPK